MQINIQRVDRHHLRIFTNIVMTCRKVNLSNKTKTRQLGCEIYRRGLFQLRCVRSNKCFLGLKCTHEVSYLCVIVTVTLPYHSSLPQVLLFVFFEKNQNKIVKKRWIQEYKKGKERWSSYTCQSPYTCSLRVTVYIKTLSDFSSQVRGQ